MDIKINSIEEKNNFIAIKLKDYMDYEYVYTINGRDFFKNIHTNIYISLKNTQ